MLCASFRLVIYQKIGHIIVAANVAKTGLLTTILRLKVTYSPQHNGTLAVRKDDACAKP